MLLNHGLVSFQDRSDGLLETQLHIRQIRQDNFRVYTVIAENSVAVRWQHVTLTQSKYQLSRFYLIEKK